MKFRAPGEVRVLDPDGYKRRAACVCIRNANAPVDNAPTGITLNNTQNNVLSKNSVAATLSPLRQQQQHQPKKEILLISSTKNPDAWLIPGGGVDPDEDVATAAVREAFEEAGVRGKLDVDDDGGILGVFETKKGTPTRTHVFKLVVEEMAEEWDESSTRRRKWFSLDEAARLLQANKPAQKEYLDKFVRQMRTNFDLDNRGRAGGFRKIRSAGGSMIASA